MHVCVDGNFHHHHLRSAGDLPSSYVSSLFIPKADVDAVGQHISNVHIRPNPRQTHTSAIDEAVNECERTYTAADGKKVKTNQAIFDDMGVMALLCRHDIPLFLANIDTPGEQQKYAVALILHLFSLLPNHATVTVLYDVGCVLSRATSQVCL